MERTHRVGKSICVAGEQAIQVGFDPDEEVLIANQAVLDHFCQTCAQFPRGQGLQDVSVSASTMRGW